MDAAPPRLARLPSYELRGGLRVFEAAGLRARALGLAGLSGLPAGLALRFDRCRSVHTWGMRFAIDVVFLGAEGRVERVVHALPPRRVVACRRARTVIETPAGEAERLVAAVGAPQGR